MYLINCVQDLKNLQFIKRCKTVSVVIRGNAAECTKLEKKSKINFLVKKLMLFFVENREYNEKVSQ